MSSAGFERAIAVSERPQTHDLDRAATEIGICRRLNDVNTVLVKLSLWNIDASGSINRGTHKSEVFI